VTKEEYLRRISQGFKRRDRASLSVYVSKAVYREFKTACGEEVSPSLVLETFMAEFTEAALKSKGSEDR
jgi:predicted lipid-binding transport protein (Tim44 family)